MYCNQNNKMYCNQNNKNKNVLLKVKLTVSFSK